MLCGHALKMEPGYRCPKCCKNRGVSLPLMWADIPRDARRTRIRGTMCTDAGATRGATLSGGSGNPGNPAFRRTRFLPRQQWWEVTHANQTRMLIRDFASEMGTKSATMRNPAEGRLIGPP